MELKNESLQYSSSCLSTTAIFHFRDYGRKSNSWLIIVIMGIQEKIVTWAMKSWLAKNGMVE